MQRLIPCVLAAAFLTLPPLSFGQEARPLIDKKRIPAAGAEAKSFVPPGWKIEEQIAGDLNADGLADIVLKLVEDKPATDNEGVATERSRALVILFRGQDDKLTRAAVVGRLLQCTRCGGAFYGVSESPANVQIERGGLSVDQDHGSRNLTNTNYRFRYDAPSLQLVLIGFDYADADRATANVISESSNYLTGVRITTRGKGDRDLKSRTTFVKKKISIEAVDYEKFEAEAVKRLKL